MEKDLNLDSNGYYLTVVIWVIGYTIAAVPSKLVLQMIDPWGLVYSNQWNSMILSRTRPSIFIPIITFAWGAVAALIGAVTTQAQLIGLRFLLGVFEAGFSVSITVVFFFRVEYRSNAL